MIDLDTKPTLSLKDLQYVDRSLAVACTRGREAVVSRFRPLLKEAEISEQQWRVLRILLDQGQKNSSELCDLACIHKVSISRIVNSLERRNFVERFADPGDARASFVDLTAEGKAIMLPLVRRATEIHEQIASDFGIDRYEQLLSLLQKLARINDDEQQ